jgi:hypothetical protein
MLRRIIRLPLEAPIKFGDNPVPAFRVDPAQDRINLVVHSVAGRCHGNLDRSQDLGGAEVTRLRSQSPMREQLRP